MKLAGVLAALPHIQAVEVEAWVEQRWVRPDIVADDDWSFREIDVARVRLIHELRADLGVEEDALPLVLSLIDQLHETRHLLRTLLNAVDAQPAAISEAVKRAIAS